jgi:hypothetical protein
LKQAAHVGYLNLKSDIYKTRKIKRAPELIIKRTHTRARMTHVRFFGIWTTTQTSKECALLEKLTTDGRKTRTGEGGSVSKMDIGAALHEPVLHGANWNYTL